MKLRRTNIMVPIFGPPCTMRARARPSHEFCPLRKTETRDSAFITQPRHTCLTMFFVVGYTSGYVMATQSYIHCRTYVSSAICIYQQMDTATRDYSNLLNLWIIFAFTTLYDEILCISPLCHFLTYAVQAAVLCGCSSAVLKPQLENRRKPQIYREDRERTVLTAINT